MDFYNDERFKTAIDNITEQLSCIILDLVNRSLEKINSDLCALNASIEDKIEKYDTDTDF